jgi:hypothetical protein
MLLQVQGKRTRHVESALTDETLMFDGIQNEIILQHTMPTRNQEVKFLSYMI